MLRFSLWKLILGDSAKSSPKSPFRSRTALKGETSNEPLALVVEPFSCLSFRFLVDLIAVSGSEPN